MELSKILSRRTLTCFSHARSGLLSVSSIRPNGIHHSIKLSKRQTKLNAGTVHWYSLEANKTSSPECPPSEPSPAELSSKESLSQKVDESPRIQNSEVSESTTSSPTSDEISQDNPKQDKLYKVLELEVLAYEPSVLDSYQWFVLTAASHLGIQVGGTWSPLKPKKMRFPLLKSAFVHKKHQVQYEVRTHHRFITLHKLTSSTADTFLEYIERNLPEGVGLKVTRVEAKPLPQYLQAQQ